jgi:hypothetical protein
MSVRPWRMAVAVLSILASCRGAAGEQQRDEIEGDGGRGGGSPPDTIADDSTHWDAPVPKAFDYGQWYLAIQDRVRTRSTIGSH